MSVGSAGAELPVSTAARLRYLTREALLVACLFAVYNAGRLISRHEETSAFAHADDVWALERRLRLPSEAALQDWFLGLGETVNELSALYYANVHFPLTFGLLAVLCWRRHPQYRVLRDALVVATAGALVLHIAYPLAPPRMLPELGFIDTGHELGTSAYSQDTGEGLSNQFAAMPSMHAGWAVLVAVVLLAALRHRARWIAVLHPVVTVLVIVVTANHYWLDAIVGGGLAAIGLGVARQRAARSSSADSEPDVRSRA